ncbi:MAG TPA: hypothetical protein VMZ31_18435 [Phycisphaerae bacterium]|nr:hypothetical protein [Phycisphaerae bacterium]
MNRWSWLTCLVVIGSLMLGCSKEEKSDVGKAMDETVKPAAEQVGESAEKAADVVEEAAEDVAK